MRRKHKRRARHGRTGAAVTAGAFAKARDSNAAYSKPRHHPQPARQRYAVSDGRESCGVVVPINRTQWRAIAADGTAIGDFTSLRAATRALPSGGAA